MQSMMHMSSAERRRKVNTEIQKIRDEFLKQACHYLFGQSANCCNTLSQLGLGMGLQTRQPARVSNCGCPR